MPIEFAPPKYAVIVNTVQERITNGTYPPGAMLPSETQLMKEFGVARPTVVRAFEYLRTQGWIDTEQGRGRFARARPAETRGLPEYAAALLVDEIDSRVRVLEVAEIPAPPRAAAALGIREGTPVLARRWLVMVDAIGPVELGTAYLPMDLTEGTDVDSPEPLRVGLLRHLTARRGVLFDHATQRTSARPATADESRLLEVGRRDCVLTTLLTVFDRGSKPVFALDVVLPPTRRELEETFPIS